MADWNSTTLNGVQEDRTHNDFHEMLTRGGNAVATDAKGNITVNSNGQRYTWDADNMMSAADINGDQTPDVQYVMDAGNRRIAKIANGTTTVFAYAGWQCVEEFENGSLKRKFAFGSYLDEPLMMASVSGASESLHFYHQNANFNVIALTDAAGTIADRVAYSSYGQIVMVTDGSTGNPFFYTGQRHDSDTGLDYYKMRYYDSSLGRFLGRDPIGYTDDYDLYQYVGGKVLNATDALGLWKKVEGTQHTWCAEKGDTLSGLATDKKYGYEADAKDWACLWPTADTKDHGYPNTIHPGDKYDASNLATPSTPNKLWYVVDEAFKDTGNVYNVDYTLISGSDVPTLLETKSGQGKTPITEFLIDGHGNAGYLGVEGSIKGVKAEFLLADLVKLGSKPSTFARAQAQNGPLRCWFSRVSSARFSACKTRDLAEAFAAQVLRKGSISWGTQHKIRKSQEWYTFWSSHWRLQHLDDQDGTVLGTTGRGAGIYSATWTSFAGSF